MLSVETRTAIRPQPTETGYKIWNFGVRGGLNRGFAIDGG